MKRIFYLLATSIMFAGCGGNGGSKLPSNDFLGKIPALYDGFRTSSEALEKETTEKGEKMIAGGNESNFDKVQKMFDDAQAKINEMKTQFEASLAAETAKLVDKQIPVTYSAALGSPFYDVTSVKIIDVKGEPRLELTVTTREALTVPRMGAYDYTVYYALKNVNGLIPGSGSVIIPVELKLEEVSFPAGAELTKAQHNVQFGKHAVALTTFTGIEFLTKEEYEKL